MTSPPGGTPTPGERSRSVRFEANRGTVAGRGTLLKNTLAIVAALLAGFAATSWWALEAGGVAVVETRAADGSVRSTRVWYAEVDGELWLEAATPESSWFKDLQRDPELTLEAGGESRRYVAETVERPSGHARIRSALREKYGLRDWWVGLLVDPSRSVAVRLVPSRLGRGG